MSGVKRGVAVTVAEFRRLWHDMTLTLDDIASALGISVKAVQFRAKHRGMPKRTGLRGKARCGFDDQFQALWEGCVCREDIAAHYGRTTSAVDMHAHRHGFKRSRPVTRWAPAIRLDEYLSARLGDRMRAEAQKTRKSLIEREMADKVGGRWAA